MMLFLFINLHKRILYNHKPTTTNDAIFYITMFFQTPLYNYFLIVKWKHLGEHRLKLFAFFIQKNFRFKKILFGY